MTKNFLKFINAHPYLVDAAEASIKMFEQEERNNCIILPTGCGKTAAAAIVIDHFRVKTLYLSPSTVINNQTEVKFHEDGIDKYLGDLDASINGYMTYAKMHQDVKNGNLDQFAGFELIILDELHRAGSRNWEKSLRKVLRKYPKIKVLGLTATEIRYLDSGRNMATEFFGEDGISYFLTLPEAWNKGYMTAPVYVIAADIESEVHDMKEKFKPIKDQKLLDKLEIETRRLIEDWNNVGGIPGIFKEFLVPDKPKKLLVFHDRIASTLKIKNLVERYLVKAGFPKKKLKFYYANSGISKFAQLNCQTPEEEVDKFNNEPFDGLKIMLSINMLNEGLHVSECRHAIFFRRTISRNIFLQQVGRVMSTIQDPEKDDDVRPVILDLVQNIYSSDTILDIPNVYKHSGKGEELHGYKRNKKEEDNDNNKRKLVIYAEPVETMRTLDELFIGTMLERNPPLVLSAETLRSLRVRAEKGDLSWIHGDGII